jgi:N utilization substance protein A
MMAICLSIKVGALVPVTVIKSLPDHSSYLVAIPGAQVLGILPKIYADREFRVGDNSFAAVFMHQPPRLILSQRSPQFFRKIIEGILAPQQLSVIRAATVKGCNFVKIAVASQDGRNPIEIGLSALKGHIKEYVTPTITLIRYSPEPIEYIKNALSPAPADRIRNVIFLKASREAEICVDSNYAGLFLGKKGTNVSTASKLTDIAIKITGV